MLAGAVVSLVEGAESMSLERAAQAVDCTAGDGDFSDLEKSL